jgi:hypothetical protein
MPAAVIMSHSRFINYGLLRSKENLHLVWRGDMISSAELGSLRGVERLGSESLMMKNITKAVTRFAGDRGR